MIAYRPCPKPRHLPLRALIVTLRQPQQLSYLLGLMTRLSRGLPD